jgi:hypothetical protein
MAHLTIGYAMSRLDRAYLSGLGHRSWQAAYEQAAERLNAKWKSIKGLRDEFDPLHPNTGRKGWHGRPMLGDRIRVAAELSQVSDEALLALVGELLGQKGPIAEDVVEALDALAPSPGRASSAAERVLTGQKAEAFVLDHSQRVLGYPRSALVDCRASMGGFDFLIEAKSLIAVEVKGLSALSGGILFTDREWREARERQGNYWLAVVGGLATPSPQARVVQNPHAKLPARCVYEKTIRASWRSPFDVAA